MEVENTQYMNRCLQLARLGEGHVAPNPMVGCVIVSGGKIVGEGFHRKYGGPHAEVNAINAVADPSLLKNAVLYVNLEPCAHFGKTPPCSDLIIEKKIPKVVIGTIDPFSEVAGKGIEKLQNAGCNVTVGVLEDKCLELNRRFFTFHRKKRPYIILKWAQTSDGFVDRIRTGEEIGSPTWITDEIARIAVHKQRSTENALFIGTNTALYDNPSLTLRDWFGKQPLRVVADRYSRLPANLTVLDGLSETLKVSYTNQKDHRSRLLLIEKGTDVIEKLLEFLFMNDIQSLIVEGGPTLLQRFIDQDLWDESHVYSGKIEFGEGIPAPRFQSKPAYFEKFPNSELMVCYNKLW